MEHGTPKQDNSPDTVREREFVKELASLINRYSMENESNTPDWILADYLRDCLEMFAFASKAREKWYGHEHRPGGIGGNRKCGRELSVKVGDDE